MSQTPVKSLIVGLTGGIGSGKSAAMAFFEELGVPCIDADIVARQVVDPGEAALDRIAERFGAEVITKNGALDRAVLRSKVFANEKERAWLESLLHPLINIRICDWLASQDAPYIVLCSPLLLETRQHQLVDRVLLIDVPVELQISRTVTRDQNSVDQVKSIIASQMSREEKQQRADDIIVNDQDLAFLQEEVVKLHESYLKRVNH